MSEQGAQYVPNLGDPDEKASSINMVNEAPSEATYDDLLASLDRAETQRDEAFKLLERLDSVSIASDQLHLLVLCIKADFRTLKANREGQTPTDVVS